MIVLDLKADNLFTFRDFHINMAYPKKIVNSGIKEECLANRPNFRYKKLIILMGANATGKTTLGYLFKTIFNFIANKEIKPLTDAISDDKKMASFTMDFIPEKVVLYRLSVQISPKKSEAYTSDCVSVSVKKVDVISTDRYETCAERLKNIETNYNEEYTKELEAIPKLSWMFEFSRLSQSGTRGFIPLYEEKYIQILEKTLQALDPRIVSIAKPFSDKNLLAIEYEDSKSVFIEGDKIVGANLLSTGTSEGLGVAKVIAGIKARNYKFFYCDEKFSHIYTDEEKAFLSLMVDCLDENDQLFFTTHNTDILDMNFPKHAFTFLKRDASDNTVSCVYASDYIKKSTTSLKNAVENDLFATAPDLEKIYQLRDI